MSRKAKNVDYGTREEGAGRDGAKSATNSNKKIKKIIVIINQFFFLQQEISFLRNEVAQLKSLLLAHKDCPVTLQQQRIRMQMQTNTVAGPAPVTGTTTSKIHIGLPS